MTSLSSPSVETTMEGAYIGPQLKAARKLRGIATAKALADKINRSGFGEKVIGQVERGQRVAKDYEIQWLADAMELAPEFFTTPAVEAETTDQRLEKIEQGMAERTAQVTAILDRTNELLERHAALLASIERALAEERAVRDEAQEATRDLLGAVAVASRELRAETQAPAASHAPRAT